ncbi:MAG: hypothetical protein JWO03_1809 [Bacteroidetes bacterium]|nr:hypothetical protein [Bacteroidota bacterium]
MKTIKPFIYRTVTLAALFLFYAVDIWARAGGGGGRSSSSSHSYGGGGSHGGGGGGGFFILYFLFAHPVLSLIIIAIIAAIYFFGKNKTGNVANRESYVAPSTPAEAFPEGLNPQKVETSFRNIQDAWQKKDLKDARRWISDGVYQRYTAQFAMMNKLSQVNKLSNIQVRGIRLAKTNIDGNYQTADVAVSFSMDDSFVSDKYPQFNESFQGDEDTEYWTFIKRTDAKAGKDLYSTNNCPNCGAPFDTKMGEISRCVGCGTLTNSGEYDWVLSEITQQDDYSAGNSLVKDTQLSDLTKNDNLFSVQRIEDVASNVFMQIMEVLTGDSNKKLARFADKDTADKILQIKAGETFIFDRLYLNDVSLIDYNTGNERLNLMFSLTATYQRVQPSGSTLRLLDAEMTTHSFSMVLSKNIKSLRTPEKETVYSYECASCGAPYNDTTDDTCTYCGEPVIDLNKNWVLTDFQMG